jgi:hypothetical protein
MSKKSNGTKITDLIAQEIQAAAALMKPTPPPAPPEPPKPVLTNHIILLLDDSGSMRDCYREAVNQINLNIRNIKAKAAETGQKTTVSLYLFGGMEKVTSHYVRRPADQVTELSQGFARGCSTPLRDAVCRSIVEGLGALDANDPNTSFLLICATDGGENGSFNYTEWAFKDQLRKVQATDRWTLAFMVPRGASGTVVNLGVPAGNVTEWNNDVADTQRVFTQNLVATNNYYSTRSLGQKSTKEFFTTDLSKLSKTELSKMDDLSGGFRKWQVDREVDITAFVEAHGVKFVLGAGYYAVTKKELLRAGRNVLVREKGTNRIYGGAQARQILGIPAGETLVTPGNHANFDVFFQSTSTNRKLVRGTELLWDKNLLVDSSLGETWDSKAAKAVSDAKKAALGQPTT